MSKFLAVVTRLQQCGKLHVLDFDLVVRTDMCFGKNAHESKNGRRVLPSLTSGGAKKCVHVWICREGFVFFPKGGKGPLFCFFSHFFYFSGNFEKFNPSV